jgi:NAD(P)H-flavin reductase
MAAGGIGITPFRIIFKTLQHQPKRKFYLFYGNQHESQIAYEDEFQHSDNVKVIHVISNNPGFKGLKGYITADLIEKYIDDPLIDHQFFICGPPIMTKKLEAQLKEKKIPYNQIHHELFSY